MIAATSSEAIPSAWSKPVVRMTRPAIAVKTKAARSVRMCWKAPSTLSESRFAFESVQVASRLTTIPRMATTKTTPPSTAGGSISRRIPS